MRLTGSQPRSVLRALLAAALALTIALVAAPPAGAETALCTNEEPEEAALEYGVPVTFEILDPTGVVRSMVVTVDWGDGETTVGGGLGPHPHSYRGGPGSVYRGTITLEGLIKDESGEEHPCRSVFSLNIRIVAPEGEAPPPCDALMRPDGCVPRAEFPVADLVSGNLAGDVFDGFVAGVRDDLTAIFAPDTPAFERAALVATYGSYVVPGALVGGLAARYAARLGLKALRKALGKPLASLVPGIQTAMSRAMSKLRKYRVRLSFQPPDHDFAPPRRRGPRAFRSHFEVAIYKPGVKGSNKTLVRLPFGKPRSERTKAGHLQVEFHAGFDRLPSLLIKKHKKKPIEVELPPPSPRIVVSARPAPAH
jgi:hypothetical protein